MFDRLIDWLLSIWEDLKPYVIINEAYLGVRLRFGKFKEILEKGIHFKLPIFDEIQTQTVVWTTYSMPSQSLTTKDGKDIVIKAIIKYKIVNIELYQFEVWDAKDAISDMTQGVIFDIVKEKTWEELQTLDLKPLISRKVRTEVKKWGIEVETVTLSDLAKITSIRLLNDSGSIG